jgi:aspartyl-tRNA synthetase
VLNGLEIISGGMRIHDSQLQTQIFEFLGMSKEEINQNFGFFIEALSYGTPPHGGIGFGIDRFLMGLIPNTNIRDFIAFPKNIQGICKTTNTPIKL